MKLMKEELKDLVLKNEIERINNDQIGASVTSIIELDNKFYAINWLYDLTEKGLDEFYDDELYEVKQVEITTKKWVQIV